MPMVTISGTPFQFRAAAGDTLLQAALRAGVEWPYECSVGACGTCKFTIDSGSVTVLRDNTPGLSARDRKKERKLGCQCIASSDLAVSVKVDAQEMSVAHRPHRMACELDAVRQVTHDIIEYRFRSDKLARFLPGQYALFDLMGVSGPRAYSMANIANDEGIWEFLIRNVPGGQGTAALANMQVGQRLVLDGPYGKAHLRETAMRDIVCIAGGSGLAPMLSIARAKSVSTMLREQRLYFYYGARTPADACSLDFLSSLHGFGDTISCVQAVSDVNSVSGETWSGPVGFVHEVAAKSLPGPLDNYEFYVSGPPPMINTVLTLLAGQHGVEPSRIHFDRFF